MEHATIKRWVIKDSPQREAAFHRRQRPVWVSWRRDEPSMRGKGEWRYLDRAVDQYGQTSACLLTAHRDQAAALRFLTHAIRRHGGPETLTLDGRDAHETALKRDNEQHGTHIRSRQVNYLNNLVEQDHRGVKRVTRPLRGFKSLAAAQDT